MRKDSIITNLIIISLMVVSCISTQAAEDLSLSKDIISLHVNNHAWTRETRLVGIVTYKDNKLAAQFNLILVPYTNSH